MLGRQKQPQLQSTVENSQSMPTGEARGLSPFMDLQDVEGGGNSMVNGLMTSTGQGTDEPNASTGQTQTSSPTPTTTPWWAEDEGAQFRADRPEPLLSSPASNSNSTANSTPGPISTAGPISTPGPTSTPKEYGACYGDDQATTAPKKKIGMPQQCDNPDTWDQEYKLALLSIANVATAQGNASLNWMRHAGHADAPKKKSFWAKAVGAVGSAVFQAALIGGSTAVTALAGPGLGMLAKATLSAALSAGRTAVTGGVNAVMSDAENNKDGIPASLYAYGHSQNKAYLSAKIDAEKAFVRTSGNVKRPKVTLAALKSLRTANNKFAKTGADAVMNPKLTSGWMQVLYKGNSGKPVVDGKGYLDVEVSSSGKTAAPEKIESATMKGANDWMRAKMAGKPFGDYANPKGDKSKIGVHLRVRNSKGGYKAPDSAIRKAACDQDRPQPVERGYGLQNNGKPAPDRKLPAMKECKVPLWGSNEIEFLLNQHPDGGISGLSKPKAVSGDRINYKYEVEHRPREYAQLMGWEFFQKVPPVQFLKSMESLPLPAVKG